MLFSSSGWNYPKIRLTKLHLLLDHAAYLPQFVHKTEGKIHKVNILRNLEFDPEIIVIYDFGLVDYSLLSRFIKSGVYFVTRLKSKGGYRVIEQRKVLSNRSVLKDKIIKSSGFYSWKKCPYPLLLVTVWIEKKNHIMMFFSNNFELGSTTIAAIYKNR